MTFYEKFLQLCRSAHISPSAAAEAMGYNRSVVTHWRNGRMPRMSTVERVAFHFGVSAEDLVGGEKPAVQMAHTAEDGLGYRRVTIGLTKELDEKVNQFNELPGFRSCTYADCVRILIDAGVEVMLSRLQSSGEKS